MKSKTWKVDAEMRNKEGTAALGEKMWSKKRGLSLHFRPYADEVELLRRGPAPIEGLHKAARRAELARYCHRGISTDAGNLCETPRGRNTLALEIEVQATMVA